MAVSIFKKAPVAKALFALVTVLACSSVVVTPVLADVGAAGQDAGNRAGEGGGDSTCGRDPAAPHDGGAGQAHGCDGGVGNQGGHEGGNSGGNEGGNAGGGGGGDN